MNLYSAGEMDRPRRMIGLMSGTSVDGIDAAAVEVSGRGDDIRASLAAFVAVPMDPALREAVHGAFGPRGSAEALTRLGAALGLAFADAAIEARTAAGWGRDEVDAVGSHGQTLWHQPEPVEVAGAYVTGTLQAGDPAIIAERLRCPVVSDFRARDMAAGGQGAPLVPLVDWLLFHHPERNRVMLNIGGIANVTWLAADGGLDDVIAFDTGPGNMVMDAAATLLTGGHEAFDRDGAMAARGTVHETALAELMAHPYLLQEPPKSTGRELFGVEFARETVARLRADSVPDDDIMATLAAWTELSITYAMRRYLPVRPDELVVTGGGARNRHLMRLLVEERAADRVLTMEDLGWDGDSKEAVAFAVLADRTMQGLPGNVPSATGASRPVVLGNVTPRC